MHIHGSNGDTFNEHKYDLVEISNMDTENTTELQTYPFTEKDSWNVLGDSRVDDEERAHTNKFNYDMVSACYQMQLFHLQLHP